MPRATGALAWSDAPSPVAGDSAAFRIFSGVLAATSSISVPPSDEAIITGSLLAIDDDAEVVAPRDGRALLDPQPADESCPSGPVWWVTSTLPRMSSAAARASSRSSRT